MNDSLNLLDPYKALLGSEVIDHLAQIFELLKGKKFVHINSTKEGGGVAEILNKMVPLSNALGIETHWEVISGNSDFFQCTKMFHNLLQGKGGVLPSQKLLQNYEKVNAENSERLKPLLQDADFVFIHDPQPLTLITHFPQKKGKWIWRCHIEPTNASRSIWNYLKQSIVKYDGSVFSLEEFVRPLPHPIFLISPSIDPFSEKNIELDEEEIALVFKQFNIDRSRPVVLQVSRFDRFKDPIGVIESYRLAKKFQSDLQLVLAGGGATDDP